MLVFNTYGSDPLVFFTYAGERKSLKNRILRFKPLHVLKAGASGPYIPRIAEIIGDFSVTECLVESGENIFFRIINRNVCKLEVFYYICTESKH